MSHYDKKDILETFLPILSDLQQFMEDYEEPKTKK